MIDLDAALRAEAAAVEVELDRILASADEQTPPRLLEAMRYSLLGGGKRLRPVLCLWIAEAAGRARDRDLWAAASSLELLHTYSLIHDDLPAMDDDDLRRGQPSCHRQFDEATAILAGDALQTEAFALLGSISDGALARDLVAELAAASGRRGMAGGQQLDLDATGTSSGNLERIQRLKTGRLLGASTAMGARCAGIDGEALHAARTAGEELGVAFQIVDDVLDATVSAAQLGKSVGKDRAQGKLTALSGQDVQAAREQAEKRLAHALELLERAGVANERVRALCVRLVERDR